MASSSAAAGQAQAPFVQSGEPLNEFLRNFWQRQVDAAEQETPDYRHPPLPLARIKKVMKSDPDVKMIAADAPILFCKACEIFIAEITARAFIIADSNKRRTLSKSDIAKALAKSDQFDFLIDTVPRDDLPFPVGGAGASAAAGGANGGTEGNGGAGNGGGRKKQQALASGRPAVEDAAHSPMMTDGPGQSPIVEDQPRTQAIVDQLESLLAGNAPPQGSFSGGPPPPAAQQPQGGPIPMQHQHQQPQPPQAQQAPPHSGTATPTPFNNSHLPTPTSGTPFPGQNSGTSTPFGEHHPHGGHGNHQQHHQHHPQSGTATPLEREVHEHQEQQHHGHAHQGHEHAGHGHQGHEHPGHGHHGHGHGGHGHHGHGGHSHGYPHGHVSVYQGHGTGHNGGGVHNGGHNGMGGRHS